METVGANEPLLQTTFEVVQEENDLSGKLNRLQQDKKSPKYKYFHYILEKCLNSKRQMNKMNKRRAVTYIWLLVGR